MGRVFTYSELIDGKLPLSDSFLLIKRKIASEITACSGITGAIICGSLNHGTHNFRSDIDVMVYHDGTSEPRRTLDGLRLLAQTLYLELNFIEVTPGTIESRFYDINWNFYQHLQLASRTGGLIKQNFLPHVDLSEIDHTQELLNYIEFKQRFFEENPVSGVVDIEDKDQLAILRKALELPAHIARKYVWLRRRVVGFDDKRTVCEDYACITPPILGMYLRLLMAADNEYTKLVERQVRKLDREDYSRIIAGLASLIPQIQAFANENTLLLEKNSAITASSDGLSPLTP